jgi:hypothetical protein
MSYQYKWIQMLQPLMRWVHTMTCLGARDDDLLGLLLKSLLIVDKLQPATREYRDFGSLPNKMEHHFVAFFVKALDDVYMICQVK